MALVGEYEPSPWEPVAEQVELYEASGGTEGALLQGVACVILTTKGRHSGKLRKTPLMRVEHDGQYAVVASLGGAPKHPVWYLNLLANPEVELQDGPTRLSLRARVLDGDERREWWAHSVDAWPSYADYQTKTEREIPVVLLEPVA